MEPEYPTTPSDSSPSWSLSLKLVVGVILFVLTALVVYVARIVFVPLVVGAILAYLLYPVARRLSQITRLSHELATALTYLALIALLIPIGIVTVPLLADQVTGLRNELLRLIGQLRAASAETVEIVPGFEVQVQDVINEVTAALSAAVRAAASESIELLFGASKTLLLAIFTLFIAFYLTADARKFIGWLTRLAPPAYRHDLERLLAEINPIWADFFRGQVMLALVVTVILTAISAAIGLPQPLLMGILGGLLEFLVSVGHTIWLIIALAVALVEGSTYLPVSNLVFALIVLGTNLIFTKFDLNYLIPRIVGERVNLHPMVVILGIIVGASVGGVLGIALAAPTIASLRVIGRYLRAKLFDLPPFQDAPEAGARATQVVSANATPRRASEPEATS